MPFICPRDQTKLSWIRFAMKGKWACTKCAGAFVFESHLRSHRSGGNFLRDLNSLNSVDSKLRCPSCSQTMKASIIGMPTPVELDRCQDCLLIWFDPREIKQLARSAVDPNVHLPDPRLRTLSYAPEAESYSASDPVVTKSANGDFLIKAEEPHHRILARALLDMHDHSGDIRWAKYSRYIRYANLGVILIGVLIIYSTHQFESEYHPSVGFRGGRSSSPSGYALTAMVAAVISSIRPRYLWYATVASYFYLYQALMTWFGRF